MAKVDTAMWIIVGFIFVLSVLFLLLEVDLDSNAFEIDDIGLESLMILASDVFFVAGLSGTFGAAQWSAAPDPPVGRPRS